MISTQKETSTYGECEICHVPFVFGEIVLEESWNGDSGKHPACKAQADKDAKVVIEMEPVQVLR